MIHTVRAKRAERKTKKPTVSKLILQAVAATHERRGVSLVGVKKMLSGSGYDVTNNNSRINQAVRTLINKGSLVNATGVGASGSFKLSKEQKDEVQRVERTVLVSGAAATKQPRGKCAAKRPARAKKPRKKGPSRRRMKDGCRRKLTKGGRKLKNAPRRKIDRTGGNGSRQRAKPRKTTRPLKKAEKPLAETSSEKGNLAGSGQQEST